MLKSAALVGSCLLASAAVLATAAVTQPKGAPDTWNTPKFMDEFSADSIGTNWDTTLGDWTGTAPGAFKASNAKVAGGKLQLRTTYDAAFTPLGADADCDCGFENIATSMVVSKQRYQYGFFEVRARAWDSTLLNSVWLQGDHSEINIMEYVTDAAKGFGRSNHHCWSDGATDVDEKATDYSTAVGKGWKTFGVEWSAAEIKFYLNGAVARTLVKSEYSATRPECMDEPMNIVLSVETSQEAGIPAKFNGAKQFQIDYVRHWDTKAPAPTTLAPGTRLACSDLDDKNFKFSARAKGSHKDKVCVSKFGLFGRCGDLRKDENMRTHAEAEEQCSAVGARLCSTLELAANVGKGIGCNFAQKRYTFTSDTTCPAGMVRTAYGMYKKSKPIQCVPATTKLHVRCCSDADLSNTGQAATGDGGAESGSLAAAVGGAGADFEDEDEDEDEDEVEAGGDLGGVVAGVGVIFLIAGVVVGVALNHRQNTAIAALSRDAERADPEAGRRASFDDCIDAVSQQGSLNESTDGLLDTAAAAAATPAGTEDPADFQENGFVLTDQGDSLRIKSVRRGNPAYLQSVYVESEAVGDGAINEDSSM